MLSAIGSHVSLYASVSNIPPSNVSEIAREFFNHLLLHPFQHLIPIGFFAILIIGAVVGILFLIKKVYEYFQERQTNAN